jgi:hypothetical protein
MHRANHTDTFGLMGDFGEFLFSRNLAFIHIRRCRHNIVSKITISLSGEIDARWNFCTIQVLMGKNFN